MCLSHGAGTTLPTSGKWGSSRMSRSLAICAVLMCCAGGTAAAQTIYPIDRAEIIAGSRFDLKVEFPGAPPAAAVRVTIDGQDAAAVTGKTVAFVEREDGGEHSAYWLRDAVLAKPGRYTVE